MAELDTAMASAPSASAKPDWDEEAIIEQIWHDLQGVVDRSTIGHELKTNPFLLRKTFEDFVDLKMNWIQYKKEHGIK